MEKLVVIGIDPGSYSAGIAAVEEDGELRFSRTVKSLQNPNWSDLDLAEYMCSFMLDIDEVIEEYAPYLIVVELTSVPTNMHTNKLLAYFEAAALISAGMYKVNVKRMRTSEARKLGLGNGKLKKHEAIMKIRKRYGMNIPEDEAEAIVFALAGVNSLLQ